jgi:hypothetical protein
MNLPEPRAEHEIDALLRGHLRRKAEQVDPLPLHGRILATLRAKPEPRRRPASFKRWVWGAAAAASLLLAFLMGLQIGPARASAEAIVRAARKVHGLPLDRCYQVEVEREPGQLGPLMPDLVRLWTRGNRFWAEVYHHDHRHVWGRDEDGTIWLPLGPHHGVRIAPDEIGKPMAHISDVYTMRVEALLDDVLRDFDLRRDDTGGAAEVPLHVVRAELKPGHTHHSLQSAVLELDAESKVIRRMALVRTRHGKTATEIFTLQETRPTKEARYRLEGHLTKPYQVYSRDHEPQERVRLLRKEFGRHAARWMHEIPLPPPKKK